LTFLFTDIEGSTRLWESQPEAMRAALPRHEAILRQAIVAHEGSVFKTMGDAFCAVFTHAPNAAAAALDAQRSLRKESWGEIAALRVRMALHTGIAEARESDYFGPPLNRVMRLLAAGHGGQILLSHVTYELVREHLPEGGDLRDLGHHRLKDLQRPEQIYQLVATDLPAATPNPPLQTLEAGEHNLPLQLTSFIGRERELTQVQGQLEQSRLVTLTGAGGCGKTRLALQLAAEQLAWYPQGIWFVELAAIFDPALVAQSIAAALGVREEPRRPLLETLADHLRARSVLLVLDNCEHLIATCRELVGRLLRAAPQLRILVTSRELLGIPGESVFRVPSLPVPGSLPAPPEAGVGRSDAVLLFAERARGSQPSFAVTEENVEAIHEICRQLDGIPLAIELAAARLRVLTPEQIRTRLDDRFRLLTRGNPLALPRHQTLRALIDWSYELLWPSERAMLRRLSVFAGGWTLEAAESVCADPVPDAPDAVAGVTIEPAEVLDLLNSLVEKSLVQFDEPEEGRYRLLETIRQYGSERLAESQEEEAVRERHRKHFLRLAEAAETQLQGPRLGEWLTRLEREHDNLRAALDQCEEAASGIEDGLCMAAALQRFWAFRGHHRESRERLTRALARAEGAPPTRARASALHALAFTLRDAGEHAAARALREEALSLCRALGDRRGEALAIGGLADLARVEVDLDRSQELAAAFLAQSRELGDRYGVASALLGLGEIALARGDRQMARSLLEQSLEAHREVGDPNAIATVLCNLGGLERGEGNFGRAGALLEEALAIAREIGLKWAIWFSLQELGRLTARQGDLTRAREYLEQATAAARESTPLNHALALWDLGRVLIRLGEYPAARACLQEGLDRAPPEGDRWLIAGILSSFGTLLLAQGELAAARLRLEEALPLAREAGEPTILAETLRELGRALGAQGERERARNLLEESLALFEGQGDEPGAAACRELLREGS
jgi:predicted ATPase/class 3 adenylate cyclase/Tfp pilus assembly protein PilF